jgi:hypothetical protein
LSRAESWIDSNDRPEQGEEVPLKVCFEKIGKGNKKQAAMERM